MAGWKWRTAAAIIAAGVMVPAAVAAGPPTMADLMRPDRWFATEQSALGTDHALEHLRLRNLARYGITAYDTYDASHAVSAGAPVDVGQWSAPIRPAGPTIGIHAVLLNNGKVLLFSGYTEDGDSDAHAAVFDPATGKAVTLDPGAPIFCGGQTILPDGKVLIVGGLAGQPAGSPPDGSPTVTLFDPATNRFTQLNPERHGRWYPSLTELPDGQVVTMGGHDEHAKDNPDVELYTEGSPNEQLIGEHKIGIYAHTLVLPNGNVFVTAPEKAEEWNPTTLAWTSFANLPLPLYEYSAGVLLPGPPTGSWKVMVAGGHDRPAGRQEIDVPVQPKAVVFDAAQPAKGWSYAADLPQPRVDMNLVLLPDGTLLGVGGTSKGTYEAPQRQSLLYDPAVGVWKPVASQADQRTYHSTAVLLPDGRVMSAGDNNPGGGKQAIEYYSPPYLFKGSRPTITSAPAQAAYGSTFGVTTPSAVTRAVLMAPAATTHATDMHQRHVELAFTHQAGGITVTAPPNADVAPPGWYMLFLLDANGVPSVARWVHIG